MIVRSSNLVQRQLGDHEIRELVSGLESLQSGRLAASALAGYGGRAVRALRVYLLDGCPQSIFQPRQLAVETLAEIGAKDVLIEYLRQLKRIDDATVRFGEDAVKSTAARELSRWRTEDVYQALRHAAHDRLLPGVVESLGRFRRAEMLPYFLLALGDDVCSEAAESAIRRLGDKVRDDLIAAAKSPNPSADHEIPSSLRRRRKLLAVIAEMGLIARDWDDLHLLLDEPDPELGIRCASIALDIAPIEDRRKAVQRLIRSLSLADWFLQTEAKSQLVAHFSAARGEIEREIVARRSLSGKKQARDPLLRVLSAVKERAQENECHRSADHARFKGEPEVNA